MRQHVSKMILITMSELSTAFIILESIEQTSKVVWISKQFSSAPAHVGKRENVLAFCAEERFRDGEAKGEAKHLRGPCG